MSLRESPYTFANHRPIQPNNAAPSYRHPAGNDRYRAQLPSLPSVASLLNEPMRHNTPNYDPPNFSPSYQSQTQTPQQHPLWHSEQHPDAPPPHIYHPPQQSNPHTIRPSEGMLVTNADSMGVPVSCMAPIAQRRQIKKINQRREESRKEHGRSLAGLETRFISPKIAQYPQEDGPSMPHRGDLVQSQVPRTAAMSHSGSPIEPPPKYAIRMRQQPMAARACGFGERDRRVVDPPPILQMYIESPSSTPEQISAMLRNPHSVVHCVLWDPVADRDDTAMPGTAEKRQQRRLMGTLVASPFVGLDEHQVEGCFFTFPDLSVRTPGTYTLRFSLVVLDPSEFRSGFSSPIRSVAFSSRFTVYNAKDFCGMRASTALTKTLKNQGCLISVKKGNSKSSLRDEDEEEDEEMEDDDDNDDEAGNSGTKKEKQAKT